MSKLYAFAQTYGGALTRSKSQQSQQDDNAQLSANVVLSPKAVLPAKTEARSSSAAIGVKCSDCGQQVALLDLGGHVCEGLQLSPSLSFHTEDYFESRSSPLPSIHGQHSPTASLQGADYDNSDDSNQHSTFGFLKRGVAKAAHLKINTAAASLSPGLSPHRSNTLPLPHSAPSSSSSGTPRTPMSAVSPYTAPLESSKMSNPFLTDGHVPSTSPTLSSRPLSPALSTRSESGLRAATNRHILAGASGSRAFAKGQNVPSGRDQNVACVRSPSQESVDSGASSPSLNKLPFFEKYARVYGSGSSNGTAIANGSKSPQINAMPSPRAPTPKSPQGAASQTMSASTSGASLTGNLSPRHSRASSRSRSPVSTPDTSPEPESTKRFASNQHFFDHKNRGGPLKSSQSEPMQLSSKSDVPVRRERSKTSNGKGGVQQLDDLLQLEDSSFASNFDRLSSRQNYSLDESDFMAAYMQNGSPPSPSSTPRLSPTEDWTRSAKKTLFCEQCDTGLTSGTGIQSGNALFCTECYANLYLPKCRKCRKAIEGKAIGSGDGKVKGKFHPECFNCFACSAPFPEREFYVFNERPYCHTHYHELAGTLCTTCRHGIEGPCVNIVTDEQAESEKSRRYHPNCFRCSNSRCKIALSDFHYIVDNLPFCEDHAVERHMRSPLANTSKAAATSASSAGNSRTKRLEKRRTIITPQPKRRAH